MEIIYDANDIGETAPLTGVDNLVVHAQSHDLFVAEDGGNMELVIITDDRKVAPFMRYPVPHSEIAGPAFDASGTRLYFASQGKRHTIDEATGNEVRGEIFEITGPFRNTISAGDNPAPGAGQGASPDDLSAARGGALQAATLAALASLAVLGRSRSVAEAEDQGED